MYLSIEKRLLANHIAACRQAATNGRGNGFFDALDAIAKIISGYDADTELCRATLLGAIWGLLAVRPDDPDWRAALCAIARIVRGVPEIEVSLALRAN